MIAYQKAKILVLGRQHIRLLSQLHTYSRWNGIRRYPSSLDPFSVFGVMREMLDMPFPQDGFLEGLSRPRG